ncbi:MAG: hypothetical protein GY849_22625 [Deltaproteobacteria bacterium]|nr:hypothetical protein [Deltaproteobacteria bacterium]
MQGFDLLSAVLYLLPGFLFVEIFRKHYPAKKDKDFARILHSILWSLLFIGAAFFLDSITDTRIIGGNWAKEIQFGDKSIDTGLAVFLYSLSISLAYARVGIRRLRFLALKHPKASFLAPSPPALWPRLHYKNQWALVITKDENRYLGYISAYTYDPNAPDEIDMLLSDADCVNEDLTKRHSVSGQGVYLKLSEISRIEFYK